MQCIHRRRPAARSRIRVLTVVGVALVVVGIGILGQTLWQMTIGSAEAAGAQQTAARTLSGEWALPAAVRRAPSIASTPSASVVVPVERQPALGANVAVVFVPRFGPTWKRIIRQGVDEATILNSFTAGVGHYVGSAMPGGVGNFAVAAHDTGYGDAFRDVGMLRIDDLVYVQTRQGWYTYRFRNFQWVPATGVGVIAPVPERAGAVPTVRLMTLTTCDPPYNAQEREVAYAVFVGFRAAALGRPAALTASVSHR